MNPVEGLSVHTHHVPTHPCCNSLTVTPGRVLLYQQERVIKTWVLSFWSIQTRLAKVGQDAFGVMHDNRLRRRIAEKAGCLIENRHLSPYRSLQFCLIEEMPSMLAASPGSIFLISLILPAPTKSFAAFLAPPRSLTSLAPLVPG